MENLSERNKLIAIAVLWEIAVTRVLSHNLTVMQVSRQVRQSNTLWY